MLKNFRVKKQHLDPCGKSKKNRGHPKDDPDKLQAFKQLYRRLKYPAISLIGPIYPQQPIEPDRPK